MGDDIGWMQPSIYHQGLMVGETPSIDRIGAERALVRRQAFLPALFPWTAQAPSKLGAAPAPPACPPSLGTTPGRGRKQTEPSLRFTTGWLPFSAHYEAHIAEFAPAIPGLCRTLSDTAPVQAKPPLPQVTPPLRNAAALLRGFTQQT